MKSGNTASGDCQWSAQGREAGVAETIDHFPERCEQCCDNTPERIASVAAHMTSTSKLTSVAKRLDAKMLQAVVSLLNAQGHLAAAQTLTR